jgi:tRNA A37 threonylcarbamoyltransferase TsaD
MQADATRPLYIAAPQYSTDNAAMVAAAGFYTPSGDRLEVEPGLQLAGG